MSLHKRGRYWHYCTTVNGELVRKSTKLTNKKAAEQFYADILKSIQTGQYVPDSQREQHPAV